MCRSPVEAACSSSGSGWSSLSTHQQPEYYSITATLGESTLRTDNQTPTLLRTAVDRLDDVDELLLVFEDPVELVVVTVPRYQHSEPHDEFQKPATTYPVPKSHIICLFRKKNMMVMGS